MTMIRTITLTLAALALGLTACQVAQTDLTDDSSVTPAAKIKYGKSCKECDFNLKNGLNCSISAKKTCGQGDFSVGSGWCVARKTDSKGYCSSRCGKNDACPSGYSCADLKTGAKFCLR